MHTRANFVLYLEEISEPTLAPLHCLHNPPPPPTQVSTGDAYTETENENQVSLHDDLPSASSLPSEIECFLFENGFFKEPTDNVAIH